MLANFELKVLTNIFEMAQNEDLEQLAFTNRKFWHLIKLTHSSAVVPKQLAINKMSIQPSRYNKKEYDLTIVCTGQSSHEFKVRGCFRHSIYSRQHDVTDIRVFNIFRNYIRYCKNAANENVDEVLSWDVYCFTESRKIPNMPVKGTPSIRLRWLFSKTIVENLCINNCNRAQFWQILMCLDNPGLIAYRKRIACKDLLLPPEDKEFFMRMLFLRQGVEFIEMRTPAFFEEMMVMPQFFDTMFKLYDMNAEQLHQLPYSKVKNITVEDGKMSLRKFMMNFMFNKHVSGRNWAFENMLNVDGIEGWTTVEQFLKTDKNIEWSCEESTGKSKKFSYRSVVVRKLFDYIIEVVHRFDLKTFDLFISRDTPNINIIVTEPTEEPTERANADEKNSLENGERRVSFVGEICN